MAHFACLGEMLEELGPTEDAPETLPDEMGDRLNESPRPCSPDASRTDALAPHSS